MKTKNLKLKTKNHSSKFKAFLVFSFGFTLCILNFTFPAYADSVWNKESASPYSTQKAYKVGDIINILILESTSTKNAADTKTYAKDDLSAKFEHTIGRLNSLIAPSNTAKGDWSNRYTGSGRTSRQNNVQARVSAWVTKVYPNGNLEIAGKHKVAVNDDVQEIGITGTVRSKDISIENTIYSYQVANASLSVQSAGTVVQAEQPGLLTRILNWLF